MTLKVNVNTSMIDVYKPDTVQVEISGHGTTLWINVDGQCVCRIQHMTHLDIIDGRKSTTRLTNLKGEIHVDTNGKDDN